MNKQSKNNIKTNLQHLIMNKTSLCSHLPNNTPLIDIERIVPSKLYHTKQHQLQQQTNHLLEALQRHELYYLRKMEIERDKYLKHFSIMYRTLEDECKTGLIHIDSCIDDVRLLFGCKRINIRSRKEHLERRKQISMEEKLQQVRKEGIFEAILFEVHLSDLSNFRQDIQKYTISPWDKPILSPLTTDHAFLTSIKTEKHSVQLKEEGTQTYSLAPSADEQTVQETENDMLCCEEEIDHRITSTSRRRRRYAVGRRDMIREQQQWQQGISMVSEGEAVW